MLAASVAHFSFVGGLLAQTREIGVKDARGRMLKVKLNKLGTGVAARVKITRKDHTKLNGYVSLIGDDSFTVVDFARGPVDVPYADVVSLNIKKRSYGSRTSKKTAYIATVAFILGYGIFMGAVWNK